MIPVTTNGMGQCFAFPDVCKTPAPPAPFIPIPYPNIAMLSQGQGSKKVKIQGKQTLRKGDSISMSSGDEPGCAGGGMVSNRFKGKAELVIGWAKFKVEGQDAGHLGVPMKQNIGGAPNAVGAAVAVMQ